jgi:hypothetical protein
MLLRPPRPWFSPRTALRSPGWRTGAARSCSTRLARVLRRHVVAGSHATWGTLGRNTVRWRDELGRMRFGPTPFVQQPKSTQPSAHVLRRPPMLLTRSSKELRGARSSPTTALDQFDPIDLVRIRAWRQTCGSDRWPIVRHIIGCVWAQNCASASLSPRFHRGRRIWPSSRESDPPGRDRRREPVGRPACGSCRAPGPFAH